jgi:hypothetical protein
VLPISSSSASGIVICPMRGKGNTILGITRITFPKSYLWIQESTERTELWQEMAHISESMMTCRLLTEPWLYMILSWSNSCWVFQQISPALQDWRPFTYHSSYFYFSFFLITPTSTPFSERCARNYHQIQVVW